MRDYFDSGWLYSSAELIVLFPFSGKHSCSRTSRTAFWTVPGRLTIIRVMAKKQPFALIYDPEVGGHLGAIEAKYHRLIRSVIEEQLRFEPETTTRNRKPLERPIALGARWELRLGPDNRFRVFYRVDIEQRQVRILAIAVKERNRLFLAGEEVEL
jgi:hypothetical protein